MAITKQHMQILIDAENKSGRAFDQIESDANRSLGTGKRGLSTLGKGAKLAIGGAVAGVAALGAGLAASVKTAGNFQQSMAGVQATLGPKGTAGSMQKLTKLAKEMGATTSFSASQAADGMKFLAQAGFSTDEIMAALPKTLSLAAAGGLELGEAADIASNVMSGMRMETDDLAGIVDKLAASASNSNTDVRQMGNAFKQVAPGAAAAGLSFDETAAALGVLGDNGIQAGAAGTALNAALRTMIKPTEDAKKAAKRLGVEFLDAQGKVRPMTEIVTDLEAANMTAKDALVLFGEEGGRAINALTGSGSERMKELKKSIEDSGGAAETMAKVQMDTFEGAMKGLGSATEGLMITLGENFLPMVQTLLEEWITPTVRKFNEWITSVGGLKQILIDAGTVISGTIQGIVGVIDSIFTSPSYRAKFFETMGGVFDAAINHFVNFRKNLTNLIFEYAKLAWEPLKFAFTTIWDVIKVAGADGINAIGTVFTDGLNAIIRKFNEIGGLVGLEIGEIDFTPLTVDAPRDIGESWTEMRENMSAQLDNVTAAATTMVTDMAADTKRYGEAWGKVGGLIVDQSGEDAKAVLKKWEKGALEPIKEESEEAGTDAAENLVDAASKELQASENKEEFKRRGEASGDWFGAGLTGSVTESVRGFKMPTFGGFGKGIADKFSGFGAMFGDANDLALAVSDKFGGAMIAGMHLLQSDDKVRAAANMLGGVGGAMMGGPVGAALGSVLGDTINWTVGLFSGSTKGESRQTVMKEIQSSINEGDLAKFRARNNLLRTLDDPGSARLTAKAIEEMHGVSYGDAVALVNILASVSKHEGTSGLSGSQLKHLEAMNIQMGSFKAAEERKIAHERLVRGEARLWHDGQPGPDAEQETEDQRIAREEKEAHAANELKRQAEALGMSEKRYKRYLKRELPSAETREKYKDAVIRKVNAVALGLSSFEWRQLQDLIRDLEDQFRKEDLQGKVWDSETGRFVQAQRGFSGTVTKPTMFLAGEQGPEDVQVTPHDMSGFAGAGSMGGGMNFTFNISALDVRGVENAIGNEIAPMIIDQIRAASRRGEGIMHSDGLIAERRV